MSIVTLVSGGLDSTVMAVLAHQEHMVQHPLFIDYGQLGRERELNACRANFKRYHLPEPTVLNLSGFGACFPSGLTAPHKRVFEDAFLPCRNLMFLTAGAAHAYQCNASSVAIGLLSEAVSIFPDQTRAFVEETSALLARSLGYAIKVTAPLMNFTKADIVAMAKELNITSTYSCHAGTETPCGICVACREYIGLET